MKLKTLTASVALALGMGGMAVAAPTFFTPLTQFEDDLLDFHIDRNANGIIDVGDSVISVLEVNFTSRLPVGVSTAILPPEHTGIMDAYVTSAVAIGGGFFNYTFGANPGGFLDADGIAGGAAITGTPAAATAGAPAGTIVRAWDGPLANLDLIGVNCSTFGGAGQCADLASDGTIFWSFGFGGNLAEHFQINGAAGDPNVVKLFSATSVLGSANFAMSLLQNNTGLTFGLQPCLTVTCLTLGQFGTPIHMIGSGTINGGIGLPLTPATGGAFARGDFQFSVAPVLPEPGTLALLGIALAGLGLGSRRRRTSWV